MTILKFYYRIKHLLYSLDSNLSSLFSGLSHQPQLSLLPLIDSKRLPPNDSNSSLIDSLKDAFLFAVPKSRRTIQKRRNRRFGFPQYHWKLLVPKNEYYNLQYLWPFSRI
uniref:39s ribosomal protein mitochondrial n=1 Tax=Triatoma infestans TaxID=30076 RepID=A0A170XF05_TRIIF